MFIYHFSNINELWINVIKMVVIINNKIEYNITKYNQLKLILIYSLMNWLKEINKLRML